MTVTTAPDPEFYLDAAKATLLAGLPTRLAAINGEHDDFELAAPDPKNVLLGGWTPLAYPTIEIATPDVAFNSFTLGQISGDFNFRVIMRVLDQDPNAEDPERLYRRVMRYTRAMLEVMLVPNAFGEGTDLDIDRGISVSFRFNPEIPERQEIVAFSVIVFWIEASAQRPT